MSRDVVVRAEAERDIRETRRWYAAISLDLGEQFLAAVDQAITSSAENPLAFQIIHRSLRRVLLRKFPYALFFISEETRVIVVGPSSSSSSAPFSASKIGARIRRPTPRCTGRQPLREHSECGTLRCAVGAGQR